MQYRPLGRTGISVSEIGLGTEYLNGQSSETVSSVIHKATDRGINYMDIIFSFPEYRTDIGNALKGRRDKVIIAGHTGCAMTEGGQYRKTRDLKECEDLFDDLLLKLHTDYVDIIFIQFVDEEEDLNEIMSGGLYDMALKQIEKGKARFIGLSSHSFPVAQKSAETGKIHVLMYPRHILSASIPEKSLYESCRKTGTGFVAMKPFAGGKIFKEDKKISLLKSLSYVLSDETVSCAVPGVKNREELTEVLKFLEASAEEKDYAAVMSELKESFKGVCCYCNHCQPCPVNINIALVITLLDSATVKMTEELKKSYEALPVKPSACMECGQCMERCPFEVDVIAKMKETVSLFED